MFNYVLHKLIILKPKYLKKNIYIYILGKIKTTYENRFLNFQSYAIQI